MAVGDLYTGLTVQGLYNDQTGDALYGVVGSPAPASALAMAGSDGSALRFLSVDNNGKVNVNASISPPSDATATGTIAFASATAIPVSTEGTSALMVNLLDTAGTYNGKVLFEVTFDDSTWEPVSLYPAIPNGTPAVNSYTGTAAIFNKTWTLPIGGIRQFRVIGDGTTGTAGAITVFLTAGQGQYSVFNYSDNQANFLATAYQGGTWTVAQGTAAALSGAWPVEITDGTSVLGTSGNPIRIDPTGTTTQPVSGSVTVSGTVAATQSGSWTVTADQGTSPWVVSGTVTANAGTGTFTVAGNLTNNNAAPAATNVGVLPAVVQSGTLVAPAPASYTAGDQVLPVTSRGGSLVVIPADEIYASSLNYYSANQGDNQTSIANPAVKPLISVRANSASIRFQLRQVSMVGGGQLVRFQVVKNPVLTGATFAATSPSANAQVDTAATSFSGGTVVDSGYFGATQFQKEFIYSMASGAPGDIYALVASSISGTVKVSGAIQWTEQSVAI